jgi:hypothetical protein
MLLAVVWSLCVAAGDAVAQGGGIQRFYGTYAGEAVSESGDELDKRDINAEITPQGKGFKVKFTVVVKRGKDKPRRDEYTIVFSPTKRPGIFSSAMRTDVFGNAVPLDPLAGDPYMWSRLDSDKFWRYALFVTDTGGYEMRDAWIKEGFRFTQVNQYRWTTRDLRALFLVGPKTGHSWHPQSKAESEAFIRRALQDADKAPTRVRCVTFTTRFNECHWLSIGGLDEHYVRAEVDAARTDDLKSYTVTTTNVNRLSFTAAAASYTIDGQELKAGANPTFDKRTGKWTIARGRPPGLRKTHGLQGPIDDAFMDGFLAVRGTGQPWNAAVHAYARGRLDTLTHEFAKWVRGDIRVKDDSAVTPADISRYNLVLFGDPGSNRLIAKVMASLPVQWTQSDITVGSQTFPAAGRALVLIYPNPLNPERYVVINSGHTFTVDRVAAETESMFFPRLGDYAVVSTNGDVALSGFFDESWKLK